MKSILEHMYFSLFFCSYIQIKGLSELFIALKIVAKPLRSVYLSQSLISKNNRFFLQLQKSSKSNAYECRSNKHLTVGRSSPGPNGIMQRLRLQTDTFAKALVELDIL